MEKGKLKQVEVEIPIPDFIPECLKDIDELEFFTLIEEGLDKTEKQVASQLFRLTRTACRIMQDVYRQIGVELPKFRFRQESL